MLKCKSLKEFIRRGRLERWKIAIMAIKRLTKFQKFRKSGQIILQNPWL